MVATLVLIQDATRNLHDQEGHLRNATGQKIDDQGTDPAVDRHPDSADDQHNPPSIDRQPPLTYRVQLPKIDVA
ncbi:hypothetical protein F2Q68_00031240 [Brassica cretica]|uniref:Uncharacterized protein n=1 Tax=Brassica cretica TaxID=69181 RepID=A0A8S9GEM0_BRACR|nr:hypothetical protein F2Q68_00031240 [Brassica cretica]